MAALGWRGDRGIPPSLPTFFSSQKENSGGGGEVTKQKLLKCCHQGQIVTVLSILERLEFKNFSCQPTMVVDIPFQCSMGPPLWNSFRRPWNPLLTQLCNLSQNYATLCPKQLCLMIDSLKILKCSMMGYNS